MCFPCFQLCLPEPGHELVLLSAVVVCVGRATVTFSLGGLDGVSFLADVGKGQGGTRKAFAEVALLQGNPSQPQPAAAWPCGICHRR